MKKLELIAVVCSLFVAVYSTSAQLPPPLDVTASAPILDYDGTVLPGENPYISTNCTFQSCLVQILKVGTGNVAHLPNFDGTPSGGDTVLFETHIGEGVLGACTDSGMFSTAFWPGPGNGAKVYGRVFNATNVAAATYWGQSATFTVTNSAVFDLSAMGLKATTMPKGVDLTTTLDSKGQTYYTDLIANLDPQDPNDRFESSGLSGANSQVRIKGRTGRSYTLQRSTDLTVSNGWTDVTSSGQLTADTDLVLSDPSPPSSQKIFYRVKVTMP
jgi:hypothetical protein